MMGRGQQVVAIVGALAVGAGAGYAAARYMVTRLGARGCVGARQLLKTYSADGWDDDEVLRTRFIDTFTPLLEAFADYAHHEASVPRAFLTRIEKMGRYTVLGGKYNRGLMLVSNTRDLCRASQREFTQTLAHHALVLGWCIELLQATFLVLDDVMDKSITRRGKPCWYQLPEVQLDAINDGLLLESFIYFLLRETLVDEPYYIRLVHMFQEVSLKTQLGQMLDLLSQPQGKKGPEVLQLFSKTLYDRIVELKTAHYSFYVPLAASMILTGYDEPNELSVARELAVMLGRKFQIQDDFLDCFGAAEHIGKIGTDIQDHKCTWLLVNALERASADQRQTIETYLGRDEPDAIRRIRELYQELNLEQVYSDQEAQSYAEIQKVIDQHRDAIPPVIFENALARIHQRTK